MACAVSRHGCCEPGTARAPIAVAKCSPNDVSFVFIARIAGLSFRFDISTLHRFNDSMFWWCSISFESDGHNFEPGGALL